MEVGCLVKEWESTNRRVLVNFDPVVASVLLRMGNRASADYQHPGDVESGSVVDVDQHANPANAYFPNPANDSNLVTRSPSNNAQIIKSSIRVDGTTLKALPVVDESSSETYYNLTFNVDCLVDVHVKIYYNAEEYYDEERRVLL